MFIINREQCVCCHNCACECPAQAIDYVGTKYQIDQDKCLQCGLCAKVCHTCACHEEPTTHTPITQHPTHTLDADVVVAGCGTGLIAAVRAAQAGKKVIVLEKSAKIGGNTDYAHAYFPVYTHWHKERGMEDCREKAIAHYRNVTNQVIEEDVLRTAVYGCGEFFDWLCTFGTCHEVYNLVNLGDADAHGPIYGPGLLEFPNRVYDNLNCRDDAIGPGWGGTYVKYTLLKAIETQNLDVTILTSTAAQHLLLDANGAICGITAQDPGGDIVIHTKAVILATGGFGKSDEKLQEFAPWFFQFETPIHRFSVPTDTGDAIDMLRELGVEPNPERMFVSLFGPKHHPFNNVLADLALEPEMVQFNLLGQRWVDESGQLFGMTPHIKNQPKEISWAIQSRDVLERLANRTIQNPAFASKANLYMTWEEDLNEEALLDTPVKKADTLEELAALCGMPATALVQSVQHYNELCAQHKDTDQGKAAEYLWPISETGPYYAIYGQQFSEAAMGGLMVDGQCRVLRNDATPIPGLYGVGDATSAMHRKDELAVISELTWAVASAYTSGIQAVQYLQQTSV